VTERVRVTGPRTGRTRTRAQTRTQWPVSRDIGEQTELGAVYLRSLMRAQLRYAVRTCGLVGLVIGGLPVAFATLPGIRSVRVVGLPVTWVVLALCIQPIWIALSFWHVRAAERTESDFTDLVERS
jgi:hypothetical protein